MAQKVSKALLSSFFKQIHPDVLSNAPIDIRVTNSAALRSLNHYFDEVQEGHAISSTPLRFFLPHKDHYREVSFTLRSFAGSPDSDFRSLHLRSVIRSLLSTTKPPNEAYSNVPMDMDSKEDETYFHHAGLFSQVYQYARMTQQKERHAKLQEKLMGTIGDFPYTTRSDPIMSAIVTSSIRKTLIGRLERMRIPSDCLFFSMDLTEEQKKEAILALTDEGYRGPGGQEAVFHLYNQLFGDMNRIPIYVADRYSVTATPGYIQVPFNLLISDFVKFFQAKCGEIHSRFTDFQKYYKLIVGLQTRLIDTQTIASIVLGRDKYPNLEEYTEIRFQSYMEMLTRLEAVFEPQGEMKEFTVVLGKKNQKLADRQIEVAETANRMDIYHLIR